jgi:FtsZ-interacting cell division protein YlmF
MNQSSDMFKKLKSLFVVEDETSINSEVRKSDEIAVARPTVDSKASQNTTTISSATLPTDAKPDAKFTDLLLHAIETNNLEGFDYLEFKNSLQSIEKVIPDESMRFKSAFEMSRTMGLTKDKLISSANHYLDILVSEDKKFKDALENQKAKQIQGRSDQLASISKSIEDKQNMIVKLNEEITAAKNQLENIRNEINDAVVKIDLTNQQFVSSYNIVYAQIYEDIEKIKSNL